MRRVLMTWLPLAGSWLLMGCAGYLFHPQRFLAKNQYKKLSYSLRIRFLPKSMIME